MPTHHHRLPDADAIRQTLHDIEGNAGRFELLTQEPPIRNATMPPRCAVVRSTASKRVYLFVHDEKPAECWHEDMEIIGFDGLRPQLRSRRPASIKRRGKATRRN